MVSPDCVTATTSVFVHDRVAVPELVRELDLDGDAAPVLDRVLGDVPRVGGRAARHDDDLVDGPQHGLVDAQVVEDQAPLGVGAAEQGVRDGLRLVVDLLVHEGREAALLRRGGVPVDREARGLGGLAVEVDDLDAVRGDGDDLVLAELERVLGGRDERGDVGAEEVLAVAEPDDERRVVPGADDGGRGVSVDGEQGERAFELARDVGHRLGQVPGAAVRAGEELGRDLGVGLGEERRAVGEQLLLEDGKVLDDPVVDHGEAALVRDVRVRVRVVGCTVRGPPRVPDRRRGRGQRPRLELVDELDELPGLLGRRDVRPVGRDERDPGRVVAAVLEPAESFEDDVEGSPRRFKGACVTHDSTHGFGV